jgi:micrococcal nuclease
VLVVCLIIVARYLLSSAPPPSADHPLVEGSHRVVRVVDGDTIIIAPDSFVRLIGVDTPETVKPEHPIEPFGPEATDFTRNFLAGGSARLSFDRERVDRFGRFLAYVWVGDRLLNEELLRAGLARWEANFNYSGDMKRRFRQAQDEARRASLGIWSRKQVRPMSQRRASSTNSRASRGALAILISPSPPSRRDLADVNESSSHDRRSHHGAR